MSLLYFLDGLVQLDIVVTKIGLVSPEFWAIEKACKPGGFLELVFLRIKRSLKIVCFTDTF